MCVLCMVLPVPSDEVWTRDASSDARRVLSGQTEALSFGRRPLPAAWVEFELEGGERREGGGKRQELPPAAFGRSLKDWRDEGGRREELRGGWRRWSCRSTALSPVRGRGAYDA